MKIIPGFNKTSITLRIVLLIWILIIFTISFYIFISIPYQKQSLLERMKFEAQDIASSYIEANKSALITDDYQLIVDYSISTVRNSNSVQYIAVNKMDSTQSFLFTKNGWSGDDLGEISHNPGFLSEGGIIYSKVINGEIFHLSKKFIYTGIEWGWIHIGLSTESYNKATSEMVIRAILLALATILISFVATFLFTKKLTKPISDLAIMTKKIESGDLSARVNIRSKDELGMLADSFNKMTEAVSKSQETLENKVLERTNELAKINVQLLNEIEERKKTESILHEYTTKLHTLEEIYKGIISSQSPVEIFKNSALIINNNLIKFYRSSAAIFDYSTANAILYSFNFLNNEIIEAEEVYSINQFSSLSYLDKVDFFWVEDLASKKGLSDMEKLVLSKGVKSYVCVGLKFQGQLIGELNFAFNEIKRFDQATLDLFLEISNQIAVAIVQLSLEEKLKQHANELQNSLKEKEVLLKEIHHRVKNNLQIITSLLYLQSAKIDDKLTLDIFKESQNRVKSLALVHEKLYQSKDLARIDFSDYLRNLSNFIFTTYKTGMNKLQIEYDLDEVFLSVEISVPLGLIVNELLSNALKYAFNPAIHHNLSEPRIFVKLKKLVDSGYMLSISDNGIGLPGDFNFEEAESLGLKLVTSLVQQVEGKLEVKPRNNTEFKITFNCVTI